MFDDCRLPDHDALEFFRDTSLAEVPVVHLHQDAEAHRVMQFAEPRVVVAKEFQTIACKRRDAALPLHLYTDGSCKHPTHASTRHAGFAVIMDLCETDDERESMVEQFLLSGTMPETLQVVASSRLQGEQTIVGAELAAWEITTRFPGSIHTHTDSQCTLRTVQRLQDGAFDYSRAKHFDICQAISCQLHPGHSFHKIKAHQDIQ